MLLRYNSLASKQQPRKQHVLLKDSVFPKKKKKVCNQERALCDARDEDPPAEPKRSDVPQPAPLDRRWLKRLLDVWRKKSGEKTAPWMKIAVSANCLRVVSGFIKHAQLPAGGSHLHDWGEVA